MEVFGTLPNGSAVHRLVLAAGGLRLQLLTYGAVVQDLRLDTHPHPLVLGFPTFAPYLTQSPFFGATVGRCANRIRDGRVVIDGVTHQLDINDGNHTLHGGSQSIGKRLWQVIDASNNHACLGIRCADGDMGFPGQLDIQATFTLQQHGVLDIHYHATTTATTLCNLAHHSYFTLGGDSINDHLLHINAEDYLPVDAALIPTGQIRPVAGTSFDFRKPSHIGKQAIDHNFCLDSSSQSLRRVLTLSKNNLTMDCYSDQPGVQIYTGDTIHTTALGLGNQPIRSRAGIAIEPQIWPDANHHPHFPQAILNAEQTYTQHTQFVWRK